MTNETFEPKSIVVTGGAASSAPTSSTTWCASTPV